MITALSKRITHFLYSKKVITFDTIEIYQYGFEIIISTIIGFFITIMIGILFKMIWLSFLYYIIFVVLRQFTGGYHAKTYFKCNLIFAVTTVFIFLLTKMAIVSEMYTIGIHSLLLFFSIITVWFGTPVENKNKPLSEKQKYYNHLAGFIMTVILAIISGLLYYRETLISAFIAFTLFIISMMIVIAIPQEKEVDKHE